MIPFILFELYIHIVISRHLRLDRDIAVFRRYIGAFVETSMPTLALGLHINSMGPVEALGFVVPLTYFIFIILSTLRLDFWLSTFTGFVAAVELFGMAMFYHRTGATDPPPDLYYHAVRSIVVLICGMLAGAVGVQLRRQFEASILAATARDRITNLFGQHVSPQVVERLMAEGAGTNSEIRRVAVMFVDFRSFTAGASTRTPQEVVDRLDGAFAVLVDILDRHGGIVNKFLGDGFSGAVRRTLRNRQCRASRGGRGPRNAGRERSLQQSDQLAAADRYRHPCRRGGGRQYRLAQAQGIHRDRRHREFRRAARGAQQGFQFAVPNLVSGSRRAGRGMQGRNNRSARCPGPGL